MKYIIILFSALTILSSCSKEDPEGPKSFDEAIETGGDFQPTVRSEEVLSIVQQKPSVP